MGNDDKYNIIIDEERFEVNPASSDHQHDLNVSLDNIIVEVTDDFVGSAIEVADLGPQGPQGPPGRDGEFVLFEQHGVENIYDFSGSMIIQNNLYVSGTFIAEDVFTVGSTISGGAKFNVIIENENIDVVNIKTDNKLALRIRSDGVVVLKVFDYTPPSEYGALLFSGSNFYVNL